MKHRTNLFSIIIPVYNTVDSLADIANRVEKIFSEILKEPYEIIFVDDASDNPNTWKKLEEISMKNEHVKIIQLMRNFGQHGATLCGIRESKGSFIITMDDDLQHLPENIINLIEKKHHDIVIAQFSNKKHNFLKKFASKIKGWFDHWIIGKPKNIQLSSFRLFNRNVANGILSIRTPYPFIPALMFYVSKDVVGLEVTHDPRKEGKSGYNPARMIRLFSNLIITNSSLLLKAIGYMGIFLSILSFFLGAFFIYKKIFLGIGILGWTSIIVAVFFIGGLLLFTTGIIGEYLIRIIAGIEKKPTYFIRKKKGFDNEKSSHQNKKEIIHT